MSVASSILVWRLGALGDTLLTLPALAALRAAYPAHRLVVAGNPTTLAPALWGGLAGTVIDATAPAFAPLPAGAAPNTQHLPDKLDLAVVWSAHHAEIARGLLAAGVPRVVAAPALPATRLPIARHYLATLAPLGIAPAPFALRAPEAARRATAATWPAVTGATTAPVALLHPGAGSTLKRWPLARYLEMARRLRDDGMTVVWTAGPAEDDLHAGLSATNEGRYLLPPLGLEALAAVLERAAVVVSADCGVAHLAALLGVRGVTLFGPTDQRVWAPPGAYTTVIHLALPCAPCGEVMRRCPSRICLRALPVEAVHAAVRAQLDDISAGTAPARAPSPPTEYHPPAPAPAPPAPLQVATWGDGHRWAARRQSGPE